MPDPRVLPDDATVDVGFHGQTGQLFGRDGGLKVGQSLRAEQRSLLPVLGQKMLCCNG